MGQDSQRRLERPLPHHQPGPSRGQHRPAAVARCIGRRPSPGAGHCRHPAEPRTCRMRRLHVCSRCALRQRAGAAERRWADACCALGAASGPQAAELHAGIPGDRRVLPSPLAGRPKQLRGGFSRHVCSRRPQRSPGVASAAGLTDIVPLTALQLDFYCQPWRSHSTSHTSFAFCISSHSLPADLDCIPPVLFLQPVHRLRALKLPDLYRSAAPTATAGKTPFMFKLYYYFFASSSSPSRHLCDIHAGLLLPLLGTVQSEQSTGPQHTRMALILPATPASVQAYLPFSMRSITQGGTGG